jgi:hypothetical protein
MARPRSTIYVAIGAAAFIVAAALVFLVLRTNNDNPSSNALTATSTTTSTVRGPSQAGTGTGPAAVVTALPIPEGKQAVAVKVAFVPAGGGFVHQGDNVNVFGTFKERKLNGMDPPLARLILSNVQVLSVTGTPGADAIYLLAVDANQAEQVIYLSTFESIYLTLVPKNAPPSSTGGHNSGNIL